jgi:hypothetical protein
MALAIYYEDLIRKGHVHDYPEIATLGHVTRARVTQIMNLRLGAPDIQEELITLDRVIKGRDSLSLCQFQTIALGIDWRSQRKQWRIVGKSVVHRMSESCEFAPGIVDQAFSPF